MSSNAQGECNTIFYADYDFYRLIVYDNLIVGIVYGVYIILYVTSVRILLREPGFTSSRPRMIMFGITTFMFAMGIIALVLEIAFWFQQILDITGYECQWSTYRTNVVFAVESTITRLMAVQYILSDIICAWRAVVLWNRDKRIIAILLFLILGTTAAAGYELVPDFVICFRYNIPYYHQYYGGTTGDSGPLIMVFPTLATNLVSTGLIAWKAWQHRISVGKYLGEGNGSVRTERILALLIESGFIYCCLWVLYFLSTFGVISGFVVMEHVLLFVSGLYPTLIIILVAMQKSPIEYYSTYPTGMQFATGPALGPTRAGDVPRLVCTICREYASDSDTHIP
ncbi:hypothetical protein EDB84DRAFT_1572647 [Lactarius hengduanensis]|nr:hypothetical protein EDB84DRAFT_1572647 [Lactarius hengduanensis]